MKNLVFGGTSFFGKSLVENLADNGEQVFVATRGNTRPAAHENVQALTLDRFDPSSFEPIKGQDYDCVFDQVCYNNIHAMGTVEFFSNRVKKFTYNYEQ